MGRGNCLKESHCLLYNELIITETEAVEYGAASACMYVGGCFLLLLLLLLLLLAVPLLPPLPQDL